MDIRVDGQTIGGFLEATEASLAHSLNPHTLVQAAGEEANRAATWANQATWPGLSGDLAHRLHGFLDVNLLSVFGDVWGRCADLMQSARESLAHPADTTLVTLTTHDFTWQLTPSVDVLLNGIRVAHLPFTIAVDCKVDGLQLRLANGAVTAVLTGECDANAAIQCARATLWQHHVFHTDLPGQLVLTHPFVLAANRKTS